MVLLAALHLGERAYGYEIVQVIESRTRRKISRSALYVTFDRLEAKGCLSSRLADPAPSRGGRPKRYITVTAKGLKALKESRRNLVGMWQGLESVLGDPL